MLLAMRTLCWCVVPLVKVFISHDSPSSPSINVGEAAKKPPRLIAFDDRSRCAQKIRRWFTPSLSLLNCCIRSLNADPQ
jgi:hypothetical protein